MGVWGGIVKISSHQSSQGGCRAIGDGDWEVLIVKLYVLQGEIVKVVHVEDRRVPRSWRVCASAQRRGEP